MGPDRPGGIQQMATQSGLFDEESLQSFPHSLTFDFNVSITGHGMLEHPWELDDGGHTISSIAPIRGNVGGSSLQDSPLSAVSQSLPPVVPKQNVP